MAVSYAPTKLRVPPGFQNLLEGLAREVLREQPDDILSFAAQYFKTQIAIREETGKDDAKKGSDMEKLMRGEEIDFDINDPSLNEAATKIQASFRGHQARQEIKEKKQEAEAATKIQASFRGHQTRKELKKGEKGEESKQEEETKGGEQVSEEPSETKEEAIDVDLADPEVQKAALKIQSSFRGHKAREEVKTMKSQTDVSEEQTTEAKDQEESEAQKEDDASAAQEESVDINLEDPEVQKAAVTIQASFRGHKAREDVKKLKSSEEITQEKGDEPGDEAAEPTGEVTEEKPSEEQVDIDLDDPDVAKAATTIQASFRGHKARKEIKESEASKEEVSEQNEQQQEQEPEQEQEKAPEEGKEQES